MINLAGNGNRAKLRHIGKGTRASRNMKQEKRLEE
jgi:hypothetical protein